jgi:hypothetical protein
MERTTRAPGILLQSHDVNEASVHIDIDDTYVRYEWNLHEADIGGSW